MLLIVYHISIIAVIINLFTSLNKIKNKPTKAILIAPVRKKLKTKYQMNLEKDSRQFYHMY